MELTIKITKPEMIAIAKFAELFSGETVDVSDIDEMFEKTETIEERLKNIINTQKASSGVVEAYLSINPDLMSKIITVSAEILNNSPAFKVLAKVYTEMCDFGASELMNNGEIQMLLEKFKEPEEGTEEN